MASLSINRTVNKSSGTGTLESSWVSPGTSSSIQMRVTTGVSFLGGKYLMSPLQIQIRKNTSLTIKSGKFNISSNGFLSTSGWTSTSVMPTNPSGTSIQLNTLTTSPKTIIKYGSSSSTIDASDRYDDSKKTGVMSTSATIKGNFEYETSLGAIVSDTFDVSLYVVINAYGTKERAYYNIRYYNSGTIVISESILEGSTLKVAKAYSSGKTYPNGSRDHNYYLTYNSNGGTAVSGDNPKKLIGKDTVFYGDEFAGWKESGKIWWPGESFIVNRAYTFTAQYNKVETGSSPSSYPSIGSLPTVYRKGYKKSNTWTLDGSVVSSSTKIEKNSTIYAQWEPQEYQIRFDLNGGKMPDDEGRISDYATSKVYGIQGPTLPTFEPTKVGYKFVGWGDINGNYVQGKGQYINDNIYDSINNEQSNNPVTFFAKWDFKPNTVKLNYWYDDSAQEMSHDDYTYNINDSTVKYGAPTHERSGDYAFLGWSDVIPNEWNDTTKIGNGWHGVYNVPPQEVIDVHGVKSSIDLPLTIETKTLTKLEDWGITQQYYGIWAKTGKYIFVNNTWKKVSNAYVKIDGTWRVITDMWTYINGEWKQEV